MATIPQVAAALQRVLTTVADAAGRRSGFIQRERKLRGSTFVQALVFGWLANPAATAEERAQAAAARGVAISAYGLDKRCTERAADCLHQVLAAAAQQALAADPVAVPLLRRFAAVEVYDGSVLALPDALREEWPGCGGGATSGAALKLGVRLDLVSGRLHGPLLGAGRDHDRTLPLDPLALPPGGLRLADLGFFDQALLGAVGERGGYWLSRLQVNTVVHDPDGARLDLGAALRAADRLDRAVLVGATARLPARLLAVRVPQEVADARRRQLRDDARKRRQAVSQARLALADWTILITNAPPALLALDEALVLMRARWQIEQLFDLWKTHGRLDETRSTRPWHILCEGYAKLLALLVQHWVLLTASWARPDRSLVKAARTVRQRALALADALDERQHLEQALARIARCLGNGCRVAKRRQSPGTAQQLLACTTPGAAAMA